MLDERRIRTQGWWVSRLKERMKALDEGSLSAMNLLFPTTQESEDLISIYLHGIHDFYQYSSAQGAIVEQPLVGVIHGPVSSLLDSCYCAEYPFFYEEFS
jgi:hypothetical protein